MARKHLLTQIGQPAPQGEKPAATEDGRAAYALRGASRSMLQSLEEMAENSLRAREGDAVVMLDPALLDPSPYVDRIDDDGEEFTVLVEAMREAGQISPVLVRPHPEVTGRYVIVYGHRRTRAAKALGIKVRAIVRDLADLAHVIAQGQENTARADLTFIEKSLFARRLLSSGIDREAICRSLSVDAALLSRMLAVADGIPSDLVEAIGAARGIGRDRWDELKRLIQPPAKLQQARDFAADAGFVEKPSPERFLALLEELKRKGRKAAPKNRSERSFTLADKALSVTTRQAPNSFSMSLKAADADAFGAFLSESLPALYDDFQRQQKKG